MLHSWFNAAEEVATDFIRDGINGLLFFAYVLTFTILFAFGLNVVVFGRFQNLQHVFGEHGTYQHFTPLPEAFTGGFWNLLECTVFATFALTLLPIFRGIYEIQVRRIWAPTLDSGAQGEEFTRGFLLLHKGTAGRVHRDCAFWTWLSNLVNKHCEGAAGLLGMLVSSFLGYLIPFATAYAPPLRYMLNVLYGGVVLATLVPPFLGLSQVPSWLGRTDEWIVLVLLGLGVPFMALVAAIALVFWLFNTYLLGVGFGHWVGSWFGAGRDFRDVYRNISVAQTLSLTNGVNAWSYWRQCVRSAAQDEAIGEQREQCRRDALAQRTEEVLSNGGPRPRKLSLRSEMNPLRRL